jgi:hypothetical protein
MNWKIPAILLLLAMCTVVGLQDRAMAATKTIELKVPQCA